MPTRIVFDTYADTIKWYKKNRGRTSFVILKSVTSGKFYTYIKDNNNPE